MQLSACLLALTASFAMALPSAEPVAPEHTIQKRSCYSSGVTWGGDRGNAYGKATEACKGFVGTFSSKDIKYACRNLSSKKKVDFTLHYIGSGSRDIAEAECYDGLRKEIDNCDRGGSTSYTNWKYSYVIIHTSLQWTMEN